MLSHLRADFARYRRQDPATPALLMRLRHQGLWALAEHRFGTWVRRSGGPARLLLPVSHGWHMLIEVTTGISLGPGAAIGPGLHIGHFGGIIVSSDATLGPGCSINQGVTIGVGGRDVERGCPMVGSDVYIGAGAKVFGPIAIGDGAMIGANAVVNSDVPAGALVGGVPAKLIRE